MRATALALLTLFLSWLAGCDGGREQPAEKPATSADLPADAVEAARRIIDAARSDERALARLEALCDGIGHRHAGSPGLDAAISWALDELRQDGLDKVALEKVMVSVWERGEESLEMLSPGLPRRLAVLGLGRSVGTPAAGITAPVLVVPDFETLDRIGAEAAGKIVLYNFPMKTMENMFQAYGEAVQYRARAAEHASRHGALAALIRSVTTRSLRTPHTGAMKRYGDDMRPIPAAAISVEDAELLHRLQNRGERPLLRLFMGARTLPDQPSANVVAELRGRERPEQIVVIGGHLDTWDVGSGAHDDGTGIVMSMEALRLLRSLDLRPRRTVRAVLFTNEERGLDGGRAYFEEYRSELDHHVAALESDSGGFRPLGFSFDGHQAALSTLEAAMELFAPLGELTVTTGGSGADISLIVREGVPGFGLKVDTTHYFDYHHTEADTFDKVDPGELKDALAAYTLMTWLLAEMPEPLPRRLPSAEESR